MSAEASAHSGPPSGSPDSFEKVNAELRGKYGAHSLTVKSTAVDVYTNYRLLEYMKGLEIIDLSVGIPPPDPKQPAETVGSNPPQNLQVPKVGKSASGGSRNASSVGVKNIKNRRFVEWGTLEEFYSNVKAEKHEGLGQLVDDCVLVNVKMPNDMRLNPDLLGLPAVSKNNGALGLLNRAGLTGIPTLLAALLAETMVLNGTKEETTEGQTHGVGKLSEADPLNAKAQFLLDAGLFAPAQWTSEVVVEKFVGRSLHPYFQSNKWILKANEDLRFPPAFGIGSTFPRADLASLTTHPTGGFQYVAGEAKKKTTKRPKGITAGVPQLILAVAPTMYLIISRAYLATRTSRPDTARKLNKEKLEEFVFGIYYSGEAIEIRIFVPFYYTGEGQTLEWSKNWAKNLKGKGWAFHVVVVKRLRVSKTVETVEDWEKVYLAADVLSRTFAMAKTLADSLHGTAFPEPLVSAYKHWQKVEDIEVGANKDYRDIENLLGEWKEYVKDDPDLGKEHVWEGEYE